MSYCTNLGCLHPQNPDTSLFCAHCGAQLWLKERYRPVKLIGRGGFGRTFVAVDEHLPSKPNCVVKQLCFPDHDTTVFQLAVKLFRQEAVRLDDLGHHPQIPELLAHFEQEKQLYLVQELIVGQTLAEELQQKGVFSEEQISQLLHSLLPVLQFVHTRYIIHRDIKPANIMRRHSDSQLVLIDFGVAKLITSTALLRTGTVVGSPEYVAPEQMRGKAFPASDLYSLGVTCIHLLTGISPFELLDSASDKWVWRDYLLPNHRVSHHLSQVIDKLLQNAVNQRYQSADEVLQALTPTPKVVAHQPTSRPNHHTLVSEVGVDYTQLHHFLESGKWQKADQETWALLCQLRGKPVGTYLSNGDIDKLPCQDLEIIDQLWLKYSKGRFGFSVQKVIYEGVEEDYGRFCHTVGWPSHNTGGVDSQLKFTLSAPTGHLPSRTWVGGIYWWRHVEAIATKLTTCGII